MRQLLRLTGSLVAVTTVALAASPAMGQLLGQDLFPSNSPWNQNISNAPVATNSATIIAAIGGSTKVHPDWGPDSPSDGALPLYGIPYNIVHGKSECHH